MRNHRSNGVTCARALAALSLLGTSVSAVRAQAFCDDHTYDDVPDFDQGRSDVCFERIGLPEFGQGYNFPTVIANWMAYLANHGFPELAMVDGPRDWDSPDPAVYNEASVLIQALGDAMGTTVDGTPSTWLAGFNQYVEDHAPYEGFSISTFAMSADTYQDSLFDPVANMMRGGGFFTLGIKWMNIHEPSGSYWANGGYTVNLVGIEDPCLASQNARLCDPGINLNDDSLLCGQSDFFPFSSFTTYVPGMFDFDREGPMPPTSMSLYRLEEYTATVDQGFVWGLRVFGLPMASGRCPDVEGRCLRLVRPRWWDVDPRPPIEDLSVSAPILQVVQSPDFASVVFTTAAVPGGVPIPARLIRYSIGEGTFETLMSFSTGVTPGAMAFDRFGELFVMSTSSGPGGFLLRRYEVSGEIAVERASRVVGALMDAMVYDDVSDELVGVTAATERIVRWPRSLTSELSQALPVGLDGQASVALSPIDNRAWVMGSGLDRAYELIPGGADGPMLGRTAILPGATNVAAMSMDPGGRLYVTNAEQMMVFKQVNGQTWQQVTESPFHGAALAGSFAMPRSRDTYTGAARVWMELDPEQGFLPCRADFNGDGFANSQDFFDFLGAFFAGQRSADYHLDDVINSQDFFDFLAAFFIGCR